MAETTQKETKETPQKTTQKETKARFYWVKVPSYVYDAVLDNTDGQRKGRIIGEAEVWQPGVYKVSGAIKRFDNSQNTYVESFEGTIPEVRVHQIAKVYFVATEDGKGNLRKTDDILADIVQERELPAKQN